MTTTDDLNLDVMMPADRTITIDDKVYRSPGDIPARFVAKFMRLSQGLDSTDPLKMADTLEEMVPLVAKLIARKNPGSDEEEIADGLSMEQLNVIVGAAAGSPGSTLAEAVTATLTAGGHPEAAEVDLDDPTVQQLETAPAVE